MSRHLHLHLVSEDPRDDDGSVPAEQPADPPSATEVDEDEPPGDGEALENRVMLDRLARSLIYLASPGEAVAAAVVDEDQQLLVAVFAVDALPELANLLLRRADHGLPPVELGEPPDE